MLEFYNLTAVTSMASQDDNTMSNDDILHIKTVSWSHICYRGDCIVLVLLSIDSGSSRLQSSWQFGTYPMYSHSFLSFFFRQAFLLFSNPIFLDACQMRLTCFTYPWATGLSIAAPSLNESKSVFQHRLQLSVYNWAPFWGRFAHHPFKFFAQLLVM